METRQVAASGKEPKYECFECFRKTKPRGAATGREEARYTLFCERCRYKFTSARKLCPYCNDSSHLETTVITADELIGLPPTRF